jgi:hypothetical protein
MMNDVRRLRNKSAIKIRRPTLDAAGKNGAN